MKYEKTGPKTIIVNVDASLSSHDFKVITVRLCLHLLVRIRVRVRVRVRVPVRVRIKMTQCIHGI